ncbi:MAG: HXXEE domain-containing protein, partial [Chloroflexota bacterium]
MLTIAYAWFSANWQYAGFVAGLFLLALVPLVAGVWGLGLLLVYLLLPIYMVHQLEEHAGDRFHRFVNIHLGHGRDVLTSDAIVVINIGLVWIVCLVALYLARFVDLGLGLIVVYLVLVNALVHILGAARQRAYNPG